ncbi:hypothetical protein B0A49_11530 [Cryomyces minteri]|uniref:Meiotically up-regulated protein Msb1/Mug8 domain-containing protein n=1 Tax=Cryomyces minteri TaxID=331657 RepID=A0A4U0WFA4_9PEZI|nr:hypothetical protein B0A49_11530 [Cryomyces minteri]
MPFFATVFKGRDGTVIPYKTKKHMINPEEVRELIHACTQEMKSRAEALDTPFLLLPFPPASNPSAARNFIQKFFRSRYEGGTQCVGDGLRQELRLTEPMVLCSIMKWCWSRLPGGVVTWSMYELFRTGEQDSIMARNSFNAFIPLTVESESRKEIIFDFFDLIAAIAARGKTNGLGGRKLSRMAGWWAFDHTNTEKGFEGGYRSWARAADATSHLFFAYLRSLSPKSVPGMSGVPALPRSLQTLLSQTEYPPETPMLMQTNTTKVIMIVDSVSPTPFTLLRRAKHFEYRDVDRALQQFSAFEDPMQALTEECRRVLKCIASANQSPERHSEVAPGPPDASWSHFQDMGFAGFTETSSGAEGFRHGQGPQGLRAGPRSHPSGHARPTTPSWADFMSAGFADERNAGSAALVLPTDDILPPFGGARTASPQSHTSVSEDDLEPGELASITQLMLDETFWWVWMTSLAGEEPTERKAAFGRCALIETNIQGARWLVMEEQVKGASPGPEEGAYIAEKKGRFSFTKRTRIGRWKSPEKRTLPTKEEPYDRTTPTTPMNKSSIGPDQYARIQATAAALAQKQRSGQLDRDRQRRGRLDDTVSTKTNSVFTLQPVIADEAGPAMMWANEFDKDAIRAKYLGDNFAGTGTSRERLTEPATSSYSAAFGDPVLHDLISSAIPRRMSNRELPALTQHEERSPIVEQDSVAQQEPLAPPLHPFKGPIIDELPIDGDVEELDTARIPPPAIGPTEEIQSVNGGSEKEAPSPPPKPRMIGRKPVPRTGRINEHPAFRQKPLEEPITALPEMSPAERTMRKAWEPDASSPESLEKESPLVKVKRPGGGGFRRLFSQRKADLTARSATLQSSGPDFSLQVQPQSSISRRISMLRKRSSPTVTPLAEIPYVSAMPPSPVPTEPDAPIPDAYYADSAPNLSHVDSAEQRHADDAYSKFTHAPLAVSAVTLPRESTENPQANMTFPQFKTRAAQLLHPQRDSSEAPAGEYAPLTEHDNDAESETSFELKHQTSFPADRWAQIRKNAAERAARMSEEQQSQQSRPSQSGRTDDGETSGEETIEARVARIKARVAELTKNMDVPNNVTAYTRQ